MSEGEVETGRGFVNWAGQVFLRGLFWGIYSVAGVGVVGASSEPCVIVCIREIYYTTRRYPALWLLAVQSLDALLDCDDGVSCIGIDTSLAQQLKYQSANLHIVLPKCCVGD